MNSKLFSVAITVFLFLGCNVSVNETINIADGSTVNKNLNTVNGSIKIGSDCRINGNCRCVNGVIRVGQNSTVETLETVNGSIKLNKNVKTLGSIKAINGPVSCASGVSIKGGIRTINGTIKLTNSVVGLDLTTHNGDISLLLNSVVQGDIIIKENKGDSDRKRHLEIEITDGSIVEGDIIVKDEDLKVKVLLSNGGKVNGQIVGAEILEN